MPRNQLLEIYNRLHSFFGPQHWWPGDTNFEIAVGAILTQNTNWGNVEKAIVNLKSAKALNTQTIGRISHRKLASLIRPAGYFNVKSKRLKNFVDFLLRESGSRIQKLNQKYSLKDIRQKLLEVNGIGPETADSILLYALDQPIFVVDAYTKRIFTRYGILNQEDDYHSIQNKFMKALKPDVKLFNEYHALIVRLAKDNCRSKPLCEDCPLSRECLKNF